MANRNFIRKQRAAFADDVAKMRNLEVLKMKTCNITWDDLFKRFLIIDVLTSPPCGGLSQDEERCLEGKLGEKCNC